MKQQESLTLQQILAASLEHEAGMDREAAQMIAASAVAKVARTHGGEYVYVPKQDAEQRRMRDEAIRRDYDGTETSRKTLMKRWDVSRAMFYRIIGPREVAV
ncbi:MAG: hypothetical protein HGA47_02165 [Zoogloea sp.]|nr:hypothetical protein [Zoogloea sp.]